MKRIIGWLLLFTLAASGCVEPAPAANPEAGPEACLADQLVRPLISSPANEIISSLLPTLTWAYPDGCVPETFRVEVQDYEESTLYDQDLPGSQSSWDTTTPLQPASIYRWRVAAVQGGTVGPYSGWTAFWTGPLCESAEWQAPELISPAQGEAVTTASPELRWQYASDGCLTAESRFEVSESEDFSALALFGQGGPEPRFLTGLSYLQDCKNYYWRVAPWKDGQIGPFAAPVQFTTRFGTDCAAATEEAAECPLKPFAGQPKLLGIACRSETKLTISFEFDAPVSGSYQLKVNNEPYVCEVLPKFPNRYYCYGPGKQNTRLVIRLMDESTGKLIFCKSDSAPICQPTAVPGNKDTTCVPKTPQQCRDLLKDPAAEWWQPTCSCIIVN